MSAVGPRRECGGLCARCQPSLPAPCFGDSEPGREDGDQRIIWLLIQPATSTDISHWLPQVTLWQKKIKSRCAIKGITHQGATSCWSEHLLFTSKPPLPPTIQRQLAFPLMHVPLSVLFCSRWMWRDHTPCSEVGSHWLRPSSIFCLSRNRNRREIPRTLGSLRKTLSLLLEERYKGVKLDTATEI